MHFCVMDSIPVLALTDVAWVAALDLLLGFRVCCLASRNIAIVSKPILGFF